MASRIIAVHSYRGGTGKSTVAANIASMLAAMGRRVALVDANFASPGVGIQLGLDMWTRAPSLNDYLMGRCGIGAVAYALHDDTDSRVGQALRGGSLWIVPASCNLGAIAEVLGGGYEVSLFNKGIQTLRKALSLDYMVIDTHPGLNDEALLMLAICDVDLLCLRPDNRDFQGTAVLIDVLRSLDVADLRLVINMALSKYDPEQIRSQASATFAVPVVGVLPFSEDVVDSWLHGIFALENPENGWSRECVHERRGAKNPDIVRVYARWG